MALFGAELVLLGCDLLFAWGRVVPVKAIRRIFNLAREQSVGTWFASGLFLIGAALCAAIALVDRGPAATRRARWMWWSFAAVLAFLSLDDAIELHERIGGAVRRSGAFESFPTFHWHLVYLPILGAIGLTMLIFLWRRFARPSRLLLLAGLAGNAVAVALDFVEGMDVGGHLLRATEETLEMVATTCVVVALARHLVKVARQV